MGQPAAKQGDQVVATDVHIVLIPSPGGPVPTPLPHPFVGIISGMVWLSVLASANNVQNAAGGASGGLFLLLALAVHVYIVVALLFFWRTKPSVA